jgi:hypothetical protein
VRLQGPFVLHGLLVDLAERLHCRCARFPDVRRATSMVLKPLVLDALRQSPRCVVLEDVSGTDPRMYRFLQKVYYAGDGCLVVTARSRDGLGCLRKLLWDPGQEIALKPLNRPEALLLFEEACAYSAWSRWIWVSLGGRCWRRLRATRGRSSPCAAWPPAPNTSADDISSSFRFGLTCYRR